MHTHICLNEIKVLLCCCACASSVGLFEENISLTAPSCDAVSASLLHCFVCVLQVHERSHTGDKPYICDYPGCGKKFATGSCEEFSYQFRPLHLKHVIFIKCFARWCNSEQKEIQPTSGHFSKLFWNSMLIVVTLSLNTLIKMI